VSPQQRKQPSPPNWGGQVIWVALLISLLIWAFWGTGHFGSSSVTISYTAFEDQLGSGNVSRVTLTGHEIQGQLKKAAEEKKSDGSTQKYTKFLTYVPAVGDNTLLPTLKSQNVEIDVHPETHSSWAPLLIYLLPILLIGAVGHFIFKRLQTQGRGIMRMGQSGAHLYDRTQQEKTTS
jgi:cell division protease FtsH